MYKCRHCNEIKAREFFYKRNKGALGISSYCKECYRLIKKVWRSENIEHLRDYSKQYRQNYRSKYGDRAKTQMREQSRKWTIKNPGKHYIHGLAQEKVCIKDKCEICGHNEHLVRHHEDYSKPLEVVTLCRRCHYKVHNDLAWKQSRPIEEYRLIEVEV